MGTCIMVPLFADAQEDMNWHRLMVTLYIPQVLAEFSLKMAPSALSATCRGTSNDSK